MRVSSLVDEILEMTVMEADKNASRRQERLKKFESSAKSSRHPGQRASKMHAARHTDKIKYPNISSNSDSNARKLRSQETIRSGALMLNNQRKPNR